MLIDCVVAAYAHTYGEADYIMQKLVMDREQALRCLAERVGNELAQSYVRDAEQRLGIAYWELIESLDDLYNDAAFYVQATRSSDHERRG